MKHRLVGAVIMVSVAVLVIPWLLSRQNIEAHVAHDTDNTTLVSEIVPLTAAGQGGVKTTETQPDQPPPVKTGTATRAALLDQEHNEPGAKQPAPATASSGWAVRVGTYSRQANVDWVVARLAKNDFTAHKVTVKTALGGNATRVWLGPYGKKKTAEKVSERLVALVGEKGLVTKHAP